VCLGAQICVEFVRTGPNEVDVKMRCSNAQEIRSRALKEDGTAIDAAGHPYDTRTFRLQETIQEWQAVLRMMVTGETRRVWIPGDLAYGS
jgi:hypothetical protein